MRLTWNVSIRANIVCDFEYRMKFKGCSVVTYAYIGRIA